MRQTTKRDSEIVQQRARKSATYRKTFERTLHQIDLALLVREMREDAGLTQTELARKSLPKVIPPRSRVRLLRFDKRTPTWRKDVGREFRVGYYSRKDGLDYTWLVPQILFVSRRPLLDVLVTLELEGKVEED